MDTTTRPAESLSSEDLLRAAVNAAGIDADANRPDWALLNRMSNTWQGERLLRLAALGMARLVDQAEHATEYADPTCPDFDLHDHTTSACLGSTEPDLPPTILEEAQDAVYGDRQQDYGHPREDFTRTAIIWTGLLQHKLADGAYIEAEDVPRCMIGVKLARDVNAPKRDNRVDGAGYFLTLDRLETGR